MWCWPTRFTRRRHFSTFCSLTANTLWRCSRMNGATSIRTWLDYSTMGHLSRVAIDPANTTGGIFQTYLRAPVRVVRSLETYTVRRQLDKQDDPQQSDWIWVTTLPLAQVPVARIVHLGHQRWDIENYGFNELANEWHSDHVFKHDPGAIECFLLVAFLAYNIFHVFLARNVKPCVRQGKTQIFWARLIVAELYSEVAPVGMSAAG